jgi:hypothetical protein
MARRSRWLIVVVIALSHACASAPSSPRLRPTPPLIEGARLPATVDFCTLASSPGEFDGTRLTVTARFATFYEGQYITASACRSRRVCVEFGPEVERLSPTAALRGFHRAIDLTASERRREANGWVIDKAADVTFVGRLLGPGQYCHFGMFESKLVVEAVVAARPAPVPK